MKKIVVLSLFLLSITSAYSQEFRLGIHAVPFISWMGSNDNTINAQGTNFGFKLHPVGEYFFAENYAFTTGIALAFNQGGTLNHTTGGNLWPETVVESKTTGLDSIPNGSNLTYKLQSVEIPFGIKLRTNEINYLRYYGEVPITVGIKTQARGNISGAGLETTKENINADMNFVNISWGIGGGVEWEVSQSTSLVAGLYFQGGFMDLTKNNGTQYQPTGNETEDSKAIMNAINIRLGVMF